MPLSTNRNALIVKHCDFTPTDAIVVNGPDPVEEDWEVYITDNGIANFVTLSTDSLENLARSILILVAAHRGA